MQNTNYAIIYFKYVS